MNIKSKVSKTIAKLEDNLKLFIKCYKWLKITWSIIEEIKSLVIDVIESIQDWL